MNTASPKSNIFQKKVFDKSVLIWSPILLVLLLLPNWVTCKIFTSRFSSYDWYTMNAQTSDLFLYGKQTLFVFISLCLFIIIVANMPKSIKQLLLNRKKWRILIPFCIYIIFVILSSICSDYRYAVLSGSDDQFESLFVVIGYFLIVLFICFHLKNESDIVLLQRAIILCAIGIAILAIMQITGHDPNQMEWFQQLITPKWYRDAGGAVNAAFEKGTVLLFSYNPNYAGVFLTMLASFILVLLLTERNRKLIALKLVLLVALVIGLVGSASKAGLLVFCGIAVLTLIFFVRLRIHRRWLVAIVAVTVIASVIGIIHLKDLSIIDNIHQALTIAKNKENPLQKMNTESDGVHITYNNVSFIIKIEVQEDTIIPLVVEEKTHTEIELIASVDNTYYGLDNPSLNDVKIELGVINEAVPAFLITLNNREWKFVKLEGSENIYYFLNHYLKLEVLTETERIGFYGYETFATTRGLIWSMTLPLIKEHVLLGSGSNTFAHVYPQNNYKDLYYYTNAATISVRPHSMYLQVAVESGVFSAIALIIFFAWYIFQSIKLYWKLSYSSVAEKTGVACMFAVIAYLICALTNDSMITVAPVFWCIIGTGIAVNVYVKNNLVLNAKKNSIMIYPKQT